MSESSSSSAPPAGSSTASALSQSSPKASLDPAFDGLDPQPVWRLFDQLRRVPRASYAPELVSSWVRSWASAHGFAVRGDDYGNLVVSVPASPGTSPDAPTVVIQGHLDMVAEKNRGTEHDFSTDPIQVERDGDWIRARGTTLGADNGLGVVMGMAAAEDPGVVHGPLELLLTLDEEVGLVGALALDPDLVSGRLLVNLDTEEDGFVLIGCAGAGALEMSFPCPMIDDRDTRSASGGERVRRRVFVGGLQGGHSGVQIHEGLGNAIKICARALVTALEEGIDLRLFEFSGGDKANAIPRECVAEIDVPVTSVEALAASFAATQAAARAELGSADPEVFVRLETPEAPGPGAGSPDPRPLESDCSRRFLDAVDAAHHGVRSMSLAVPGLVETSTNLAIARIEDGVARIVHASRSSSNAALESVLRSLESQARLLGASTERRRGYPGWSPDPASPLLARTVAVYRDLHGEAPEVEAVHAGLECGVLAEKLPGLDAVSFGPTIRGPHSPDERASIESTDRSWRWLVALLGDLATGAPVREGEKTA